MSYKVEYKIKWQELSNIEFIKYYNEVLETFKAINNWLWVLNWKERKSIREFENIKIYKINYDNYNSDWTPVLETTINNLDWSIEYDFLDPCEIMPDFESEEVDITDKILNIIKTINANKNVIINYKRKNNNVMEMSIWNRTKDVIIWNLPYNIIEKSLEEWIREDISFFTIKDQYLNNTKYKLEKVIYKKIHWSISKLNKEIDEKLEIENFFDIKDSWYSRQYEINEVYI